MKKYCISTKGKDPISYISTHIFKTPTHPWKHKVYVATVIPGVLCNASNRPMLLLYFFSSSLELQRIFWPKKKATYFWLLHKSIHTKDVNSKENFHIKISYLRELPKQNLPNFQLSQYLDVILWRRHGKINISFSS